MRAAPIITSLNAGELSPTLDGRVDLQKYANGCKVLENFFVLPQGPGVRRGGTRFVKAVKNSAHRNWLVKFEFSATQCFYVEFGDLYLRFYTNHASLVVSGVTAWSNATAYLVGDLASRLGINYYCIAAHTNQQPPNATYWYPLTGSTYEIPSPYAVADLTKTDGSFALKIEQSGDVMYIASAAHAPRKLVRYGNTNWQFSLYQPNQGPLLEQNITTTTMYASAATGSITITASAAVFAATDVGRLVRIDVQNIEVRPWETNKGYSTNDLARSNGKTYKALNNATSGTDTPFHERGSAYDGKTGVQWQYMDSGYGIARITAYTSPTVVTASVIVDEPNGLAQMPADVIGSGNASKRWQLGTWSATTEWPTTVTFWKARLCWAGKQRGANSVPNDFENMSGDFFGQTEADNAIWWQLQSKDVNDILFMIGADKLVIGTGGGEFVGSPITTTAPVGPANFEILPQSKKRVRSIQPVGIGTSLCYVQRAGRKLLSMNYDIQKDRFASIDLAVLAERITRTGIIDMAYQGEPHSLLWSVLSNGALRGFTYDPEQEVTGWHRHPIGGTDVVVESVAAGPAPDGSRDELWLIVKRTINGATVRTVEFMERPWEGPDEDGTGGDDQEDAFYVDCGLTYDGAPATTITGLDHLIGETVQILADGAVQPDQVVSGAGEITLSRAASVVQIGLRANARCVPMRIEAGSQDGTSQGKIKRINGLIVRFLDTLGGKIGRYRETLDPISLRSPSTPMGSAPPIGSGDHVVDFPGGYDRDALIEIRQDQPLPMTISAIMPRLHVNG